MPEFKDTNSSSENSERPFDALEQRNGLLDKIKAALHDNIAEAAIGVTDDLEYLFVLSGVVTPEQTPRGHDYRNTTLSLVSPRPGRVSILLMQNGNRFDREDYALDVAQESPEMQPTVAMAWNDVHYQALLGRTVFSRALSEAAVLAHYIDSGNNDDLTESIRQAIPMQNIEAKS